MAAILGRSHFDQTLFAIREDHDGWPPLSEMAGEGDLEARHVGGDEGRPVGIDMLATYGRVDSRIHAL